MPFTAFVGPPAVGKTSLGQSIARAIARPVVRVAAAAAAGLTRVMLPARNRRDFGDIPDPGRRP